MLQHVSRKPISCCCDIMHCVIVNVGIACHLLVQQLVTVADPGRGGGRPVHPPLTLSLFLHATFPNQRWQSRQLLHDRLTSWHKGIFATCAVRYCKHLVNGAIKRRLSDMSAYLIENKLDPPLASNVMVCAFTFALHLSLSVRSTCDSGCLA
jgi:hypothetical protein